jgi:hypothetical protein
MPLHRNLLKMAGKGVLTGAELGPVETRWREEVERRPVGDKVIGGVLQLQGQEEDMRSRFGLLVSDEKHDGEELTVDGERHSRDPTWRVEEVADDDETWGKTTARPRRLATRKESRNSAAKRWLAGGEWETTYHLGIGEKL